MPADGDEKCDKSEPSLHTSPGSARGLSAPDEGWSVARGGGLRAIATPADGGGSLRIESAPVLRAPETRSRTAQLRLFRGSSSPSAWERQCAGRRSLKSPSPRLEQACVRHHSAPLSLIAPLSVDTPRAQRLPPVSSNKPLPPGRACTTTATTATTRLTVDRSRLGKALRTVAGRPFTRPGRRRRALVTAPSGLSVASKTPTFETPGAIKQATPSERGHRPRPS